MWYFAWILGTLWPVVLLLLQHWLLSTTKIKPLQASKTDAG